MANDSGAHRRAAGFDPIIEHYERCLEQHGATPQGVDWPNGADLATRFEVMLSTMAGFGGVPEVLDLGCGPGLLLDYLRAKDRFGAIAYRGIDFSPRIVAEARRRWPGECFEVRDIVENPLPAASVDFIVMNGVLTERRSIPRPRMVELAQGLIRACFPIARVGIAFNAMRVHVDWERDDLFHWSFDEIATFLRAEVSPHYAFRADYGLYEFTTIVRHEPLHRAGGNEEAWWLG